MFSLHTNAKNREFPHMGFEKKYNEGPGRGWEKPPEPENVARFV